MEFINVPLDVIQDAWERYTQIEGDFIYKNQINYIIKSNKFFSFKISFIEIFQVEVSLVNPQFENREAKNLE